MRVLLVGPALPFVGGQAVQARMLIEKFAEDDEVHIDLQPINPRFLPRLQEIKYVRTCVTTLKYLFDLVTKIPRYDVIHIFSASYFSFLLAPTPALLVARLFGKKTILNYRSGEADEHLKHWKTAVPTIRLFDRIVAPSGYLVAVFGKHGLEASSIFNVVDTGRFVFRKRDPVRPLFLSNRNLEPLYNVGCIVRAFARIQSVVPEARLLIAGDGSERDSLANLVANLGLTNVEFLGSVAPADMPRVYDRADIYLNSPNLDNMPNSIIEAFASGLAVVSTNAGGIPYIVEHERNGLLVEVGDHETLAREGMRLLEEPGLVERITGRAKADCENYSWSQVRDQWVKLYRELAGGRQYVSAAESSVVTPVEN